MSIKSTIKSTCLGLLAVASLISCSKDKLTPVGAEAGSALVQLSIYTPSSSVPQKTKNAEADESAVDRIKLVVLQKSGNEYRYRYMVDGQQIVQDATDSKRTKFNALLKSSDVPLKILLLANHNDVFSSAQLVADMDEAEVKQLLIDSFRDDLEGDLPIYGELNLEQLDAEQPNSFAVTMLREVARVDVNNTIDEDFSEKFRLESVSIYRANDRISVVPDASAMQTEGKMTVSSASVPSTATTYEPYSRQVAADGDLSIIKTYLPESLPVTDVNQQTATATCVVVGGYYADDAVATYYRIDFDSGLEGHPFGQVLRNHKYIFNIKQVNGRGWETPEEAAENEATAITATIQIWDELTSEMWFTGDENYIGISSRLVILNYFAYSEALLTLQATVPFRIQALDDNGNPTGASISTAGQSFQHDFFQVELQKDDTDGEDVWRLVINSLRENRSGSNYTGKFQVITDWWTFDVDVIQENFAAIYTNRFVRILTITDLLGDLGTTDGTLTSLSGAATRRMLENPANFSPSGTVPVGGIIINNLRNETVSSETSADLYTLQKMLETVDVVHLPYRCSPSEKASQLIANWLNASPNRVLILGTDDQLTNYYLQDIFDTDGEWQDGSDKITGIGSAYEDDVDFTTDPFFKGVFGNVVPKTNLTAPTKEIIGYNDGYNYLTTIPILMVTESTDNSGMMTHGVHTSLGIVYFGDSGVTSNRGSAMSDQANATGTVITQFDILMANLWAWIVDRVVMVPGGVPPVN